MFQLSDKTRRPLCMAIFFFVCVLPTFCVCAWGVSRSVPWHADSQARRLGERLGLEVSLEDVEHPRPGVVVYRNLKLSNPETGATMLHCDRLRAEWTRSDEATESRLPCLLLIASRAKVDAAEKDSLWPLVQRMLAREVGSPGNLRLAVERLEVRRSRPATETSGDPAGGANPEESARNSQATLGPSYTLTHVCGKVDTFEQWMQAKLEFQAAWSGSVDDSEAPEPTRICVQRNRQADRPFTSFDLETGGQAGDHPDMALPCDLLGLFLQPFAGLGPESRFRGHVWADVKPHGHDGEFQGEFLDVDLDGLVTNRFPDQLSGKANLIVYLAQFHQGRLLNVNARIDARNGVISGALLNRAIMHLGLRPWDLSHDLQAERPLSFQQIAASFVLDGAGLHSLQGTCLSNTPNTIMADNYGPVLLDPLRVTSPLAAVVRTLAPESAASAAALDIHDLEALVPATWETARLMARLPMPRQETTLR